MASGGCKVCVVLLFVLLFIIGIGIYYRTEIQDYFDQSPKIIYRNETLVNAFLIKKYYKSSSFFHSKMTIHASNDPNETELYRINWYRSTNMTLTRIKDKSIVSRAQRISLSSYSFELFGQLITTGKITQQKTNEANFDIEYINHNHETSNIVLRSCKKEMELIFKYFQWNVMWLDMTQRFVIDNRGRMNIEMINLNQHAYLSKKINMDDFNPIFRSVPNPYVYDLYVLKYLPDELYLTTLIISDHVSHSDCNQE